MRGLGRLDHVATGETFGDARNDAPAPAVAPPEPPQPAYALSVTVKDRKDEARLATAIAKLCEEDASLVFAHDQEAGEMRLFGQGEMHVRVALERLAARFGVVVETQKPSVGYKETIRHVVNVRGRHKKQSGGHGQFGDVVLDVGPLPRGDGFAFNETVHGGTVPRNYPRSRRGCRDALERGPLGFPVVDVAVTLTDGSYHTVDSSDMAFRTAARMGVAEALAKGRPGAAGADPVCGGRRAERLPVAHHRHRLGTARTDPRL